MLFTEETAPGNKVRIYATQLASVVTYFTDDGEGGTMLTAELGEFACPYSTTAEKVEAVKQAVMEEAARRLNCPVDKVLCRSMADLSLVTDRVLKEIPKWTGRRFFRALPQR